MEKTIEELRDEATDLGIEFKKLANKATLQKLIDDKYDDIKKADEAAAVAKKETKPTTGKSTLQDEVAKAKEEANKTRIITIVDNDQRVSNKNSTAVVNCSNQYFDLGTMILPLNKPVEVRQGHINVLKEVRIPLHKDLGDMGLADVTSVKRYNIEYNDVE